MSRIDNQSIKVDVVLINGRLFCLCNRRLVFLTGAALPLGAKVTCLASLEYGLKDDAGAHPQLCLITEFLPKVCISLPHGEALCASSSSTKLGLCLTFGVRTQ